MLTERDEERLIDYALGEVDAGERYELSKSLAADPEGEAAETAEDYQALAALAGRALQQERSAENNGQLSPAQRAKLLREMNRPEEKSRRMAKFTGVLLRVAAVLVLVAAVSVMLDRGTFFGPMREAARRSSPESEARVREIERLSELADARPQQGAKVAALRKLKEESEISSAGTQFGQVVDASGTSPLPAPAAEPAAQSWGMAKAQPADGPSFVEQRTRILEAAGQPAITPLASNAAPAEVAGKPIAGVSYSRFLPPSAEASAPAPPAVKVEQLQSLGYVGDPRNAGRRIYADFDGDGVTEKELGYRYMPSPGGEQYNVAVESSFQPVAQQPLSTFSIDVDTAGYSNVRRMLTQGQWPPAEAVRIEEMLNYFDYSYPQPTTADPFSVNVEMARCPWAPEHHITKIGVQGREIVQNDRPAANLVFLIDCSGSMQPANKLPLVRESMKALFAGLDARDRVGIVTYAGDARIALPSTSCDARETIVGAIDSLNAGGSTNGQAGIQQAYDMAAANFISGGVNRVILATDGDFNVGVTDTGSLLDMIAQRAKGKIFLTALGFGMGNLKDGRLEELADKGNGNYAYIDTFAEARKALGEDLQGTLVTIAKDVKIQVEFNPARVQAYRLIGYDNRLMAAQDFNNDQKDAGEIGAGHTVTALYEIVPIGAPVQAGVDALKYQTPAQPVAPLPTEPGTGEWMNVKLRYKQPEGDTSTKIEVPVLTEPSAIESATPDMKLASGVAAFGMVLRNSQHRGNADLNMAQQLAEASIVQGYGGGDPHAMERLAEPRRELIDLIVRAKTLR